MFLEALVLPDGGFLVEKSASLNVRPRNLEARGISLELGADTQTRPYRMIDVRVSARSGVIQIEIGIGFRSVMWLSRGWEEGSYKGLPLSGKNLQNQKMSSRKLWVALLVFLRHDIQMIVMNHRLVAFLAH